MILLKLMYALQPLKVKLVVINNNFSYLLIYFHKTINFIINYCFQMLNIEFIEFNLVIIANQSQINDYKY